MMDVDSAVPARREELLLTPLGEDGRHVVKDPVSGEYFHLGASEIFLLKNLNGRQTPQAVCAAFEEQFDEPLDSDELAEFIELARSRGFLRPAENASRDEHPSAAAVQPMPARRRFRQSILYWRISLFNPDRLFDWLVPKLMFLWTRAFLAVSAVSIVVAAAVTWANGAELLTKFSSVLRWETALLVWLTLLIVTTVHEFAHGMTCKRYGGEVREIGFLLMFFIPCFYCNVSDAWRFREKSKRLWVTFAGGYCDLCVWAFAVIVWRLTYQDSLPNYLAWVVMSVAGFRVFFNLNPLIKLDGYYLLSDWLDVPNLRLRAFGYIRDRLRSLWRWNALGSDPVTRRERRIYLSYGLFAGVFSFWLVGFIISRIGGFLVTEYRGAGFVFFSDFS